ncbi:MAG: guanylyltransferase [Planctomycetaceae bacterium]|nr:guanylyltransferase [Planctomycetaceae bacterium]
MKFDDLDARMRAFETALDFCVLPDMYMVARLDGRSFTRLTKEKQNFEAPFDERFRDLMVATTEHLMDCGFRTLYGCTQSDEISLLFHRDEQQFQRKLRKLNSVLAGEASAKFSLLLGDVACFDCRISQLPNVELVCDYFRWRSADAARNALNGHCYWLFRKQGLTEKAATEQLLGMSSSAKNELLFGHGINFNELPNWHKRGVGLYWEQFDKIGTNPVTGQSVVGQRRRLKRDFDLPMKDDYGRFIADLICGGGIGRNSN